MSRSLQIIVDLTVDDDANDYQVADVVFQLLVSSEQVEADARFVSVDGTWPQRGLR